MVSALLQDFPQIRIIAEASEYDIGSRGGLGNRPREPTLVLRAPTFGLFRATIEYCNAVPGLTEPTSHRVTHDAQTDKRNVLH
jgi:hypothetical protein